MYSKRESIGWMEVSVEMSDILAGDIGNFYPTLGTSCDFGMVTVPMATILAPLEHYKSIFFNNYDAWGRGGGSKLSHSLFRPPDYLLFFFTTKVLTY